jgi:16S rRNA (uracil1498-N3)-methyltransferase
MRAAHERGVLFWEDGAVPLEPGIGGVVSALVVTGAEGGFSAAEARAAEAAGFALARLGPRILRAETAAIVAAAVVQLLWGDLASPAR